MKIGLLSDTHGHLDKGIMEFLKPCAEVWHAGDIGPLELGLDPITAIHNTRSVYGNIDNNIARAHLPEIRRWEIQGIRFLMTHIGGRPPRYAKGIRELLKKEKPHVFICGHSHILLIKKDPSLNLMFMNPGAAGKYGIHTVRTLVRFDIIAGKMTNMEILELPK
ncbi:MAG: putative phosphoesterase [Luteibaculaceae bacterium]|jgi:putative phosphoesterase